MLPEEHDQDQQRHERQERLRNDGRYARRHPDHDIAVGQELLNSNRDDGDEDRDEQSLRSESVHSERALRQMELQHQERDRCERGAGESLLLQAFAKIVCDGKTGYDCQQTERGCDRYLQQREVGTDSHLPSRKRQIRHDQEEPADDGQRNNRHHSRAYRREVRVLAERFQRAEHAHIQHRASTPLSRRRCSYTFSNALAMSSMSAFDPRNKRCSSQMACSRQSRSLFGQRAAR